MVPVALDDKRKTACIMTGRLVVLGTRRPVRVVGPHVGRAHRRQLPTLTHAQLRMCEIVTGLIVEEVRTPPLYSNTGSRGFSLSSRPCGDCFFRSKEQGLGLQWDQDGTQVQDGNGSSNGV